MKHIDYISENDVLKIDPDVKRVRVAGAIIFKNFNADKGKLLIIQRAKDDHWPNFWEIPRGKVEDNEKIKQGLLREVKEETGLQVIPLNFFNKFNYVVYDNGILDRVTTQFNFICKMKNENDEIKLSHEHQDFKWISYDAEAELYLNAEIKQTVMMALNKYADFNINTGYEYKSDGIDNISETEYFKGLNYLG
jgi:8-oxo-dGTP diphosphatase